MNGVGSDRVLECAVLYKRTISGSFLPVGVRMCNISMLNNRSG